MTTTFLMFLALAAEPAADPEVRLSEGEVLEMASGEIEKAAAIYREVLAIEGTPDPVRIRALYLLARCERKRGNLREAERLLAEIVSKEEKVEPFRLRAERLLREIRGGGADPAPDWLAGLQENESIRAQIFQLAMDLVNPETDEGFGAARRLVAMGTLAQPVLRTVIQTTRDPAHRRTIASLLARMGDFGELAAAIDPQGNPAALAGSRAFSGLFEAVLTFDEAEAKRFLAALRGLPDDPLNRGCRALLMLATGEGDILDDALRQLEADPGPGVSDPHPAAAKAHVLRGLSYHLRKDPRRAEVVVRHLLDPAAGGLREPYFHALAAATPDALTGEVIFNLKESFWREGMGILQGRKDYASMRKIIDAALADGKPEPDWLPDVVSRLKDVDIVSEDAGIAGLIRDLFLTRAWGAGSIGRIAWCGGPISVFDVVRFFNRHEEALPDLDAMLRKCAALKARYDFDGLDASNAPRPGPGLLRLIRQLAVDSQPMVRASSTLRECARTFVLFDPDLIGVFERHLTEPELVGTETKAYARWGLFRVASLHPERAGDVVRILAVDYVRAREEYEDRKLNDLLDPDECLALLRAIVDHLDGEPAARLGKRILERLGRPVMDQDIAVKVMESCRAAIEKDGEGERRALMAIILSGGYGVAVRDRAVAGFLEAIVGDEGIDNPIRLSALLALQQAEGPREIEKALEVVDGALSDSDVTVRRNAVGALKMLNHIRIAPLLAKAMRDEDDGVRAEVIPILGAIGGRESIDALVQALDDRNLSIRAAAQEALRKIKERLQERDEWRKWAEENRPATPAEAKK